jgi:hypothetical protein
VLINIANSVNGEFEPAITRKFNVLVEITSTSGRAGVSANVDIREPLE